MPDKYFVNLLIFIKFINIFLEPGIKDKYFLNERIGGKLDK